MLNQEPFDEVTIRPLTVCDHLRNLRKLRGYSVRELARALGVSVACVSCVEGRGQPPSPDYLERAAHLFGIPAAELLARCLPN